MASASDTPPGPGPARDATIDPEEIARFEALAAEWWNPDGRFRQLHRLNPERLRFIRDRAAARFGREAEAPRPLEGLSVLDIGCGGGLVAEPLARLGARVTGLDPSEKNVGTARAHARGMGLDIAYRAATAEALAAEGARFDLVLMLEVIEHVADVDAFMDAAVALTRPGGALVAATLNRTLKSFALAILGAEYVMRWLPVGTHDWNRFLTPEELSALMTARGLTVRDVTGLIYNPLTTRWRQGSDTGVNYMIFAVKD